MVVNQLSITGGSSGPFRTACAAKLLSLLLLVLGLLLLDAPTAQAQYFYTNNYGIWGYATNKGAIIITGYTGSGGDVTISDTITYLPVTSIGFMAFANCYSLTSVTIPDNVTSIGDTAFFWCTSLTNVTIPNSVTSIAEYAFADCTSLTSITIPGSVTSIWSEVFQRCYSLATVTIGNGVTSIGGEAFVYCTNVTSITFPASVTNYQVAFFGCTSLTTIMVDALNPAFSSVDGVFFDKSTNLRVVRSVSEKQVSSGHFPNSKRASLSAEPTH